MGILWAGEVEEVVKVLRKWSRVRRLEKGFFWIFWIFGVYKTFFVWGEWYLDVLLIVYS